MNASPAAPSRAGPAFPHRRLGVLLLIVGTALLAAGIAAAAYCTSSFLGICFDNPYAGAGAAMIVVGVVLLVVGIILLLLPGTTPPLPAAFAAYPSQPSSSAPPAPGARQSPQPFSPSYATPSAQAPPTRYCPTCGAGSAADASFCASCGGPLGAP